VAVVLTLLLIRRLQTIAERERLEKEEEIAAAREQQRKEERKVGDATSTSGGRGKCDCWHAFVVALCNTGSGTVGVAICRQLGPCSSSCRLPYEHAPVPLVQSHAARACKHWPRSLWGISVGGRHARGRMQPA
jgi:hypothetical protein